MTPSNQKLVCEWILSGKPSRIKVSGPFAAMGIIDFPREVMLGLEFDESGEPQVWMFGETIGEGEITNEMLERVLLGALTGVLSYRELKDER